MWKEFFYYSKSERRAVYVLCVVIVLFLVGIWMMPDVSAPLIVEAPKVDSATLKEFHREVRARQYVLEEKKDSSIKRLPTSLFAFDPNRADSFELSRLGLPSFVVRNILKYRQQGGRFKTVESFSRIYGLKKEQFETLKPYIRILDSFMSEAKQMRDTIEQGKKSIDIKELKYSEETLVDVNAADTTELKKIPGIGSGIARAIVAYRDRLGGFYSLHQLEEVKYTTPALMKWFKLESSIVRPLKVNEANLETLRSHPYINFYQAKTIVEHRRKKGKIKSLSQLSLYEEFTEKDLERLSAYLIFD